MTGVNRRTALGAFGVGAVGVGLGAGVLIDKRSAPVAPSAGLPSDRSVTVASWASTRGNQYFIGHRGSGDVYPEHSMEGYRAVAAAGAQCIEISVGMTSDRQLICMHDATFDRTTNSTGIAADVPSTVLRGIRLNAPQLGPSWGTAPLPQVPLLTDVLDQLGGKVVLCIEAKDDDAYPEITTMIESRGLKSTVIIKANYTSDRIAQAKAVGYPIFAYFGTETDATSARINTLASQLDPKNDYLILPNSGKNGYLDADLVRTGVKTGIPVWIYAAHRRVDASHFFGLGCAGIVASSYPYLATAEPVAEKDTWSFGAITPGEMTRDPGSVKYAPTWLDNQIHLGASGTQHFLTLGQLGPLAKAGDSYTVRFDASWLTLPATLNDNLTLAFGRTDDSYYEHRIGHGNGYHAILRANGSLELFRHDDGKPDGVSLGHAEQTPAPTIGQWMQFELTVTPSGITWSRRDVSAVSGTAAVSVSATEHTYRGGYLHIGRSSTDGVLAFRSLSVS